MLVVQHKQYSHSCVRHPDARICAADQLPLQLSFRIDLTALDLTETKNCAHCLCGAFIACLEPVIDL